MRNYPSDRWFSVVFIVAGGVSLWCVLGADAAGDCTGIRTTAMEAEAVTETAETEVLDAVTDATETVPVETITS